MEDGKGLRKGPPGGGLSGADFAGVGIQFAAALIVFLFAGQWLDKKFGTGGVFTLVSVFVGGGAAFYSMYRKISAAQRRDDDARKAKQGSDGNSNANR